ncbi:MAG: YidB family protein [Chlorobiales bacterium]|nr:YidB family protein [Chlorobiales bacterium]
MNIEDLLDLGASVIKNNSDDATTSLDPDQLSSALGNLFGGSGGKLDFGTLLGKMKESGLDDIASSWLGNGKNASISGDVIRNLLGSDKIADFASMLGLSEKSAETAIADALPEMVDKASPDGSLLENIIDNAGGIEGLLGMARKFFS